MSNASRQAENNSKQASPPNSSLAPGLTAAHFTERELAELWKICRDADNERHAKQILGDALARAGAK